MTKVFEFLITFLICVTSTKAFSTCRLTDGRILSNGTSAFVSCDTKCTCLIYSSYYHVLCEATCLGNSTTQGCSMVRKPGNFCCRQEQCPTDVKLDQCSTVNSATEDLTTPWHIRIRNNGAETCAGASDQVLKNEPHLGISTLIAVNSHKNLMPGYHDINPAPDENFCRSYPSTNCALFISYFDPQNGGRSGRLAGILSNDTQCVSKGRNPKTKCVQVTQSPAVCRDLSSGSGVFLQVNSFPYLVGVLAVDQACSERMPALIPFYDVCNDIQNVK